MQVPTILITSSLSKEEYKINRNKLKNSLFIQSLSMLRSIIVITRVACFPWNILLSLLKTILTEEETPPVQSVVVVPNLKHLQILLEPFVSSLEVLGFTTASQIINDDDDDDDAMAVDNINNNDNNNNDKIAMICFEAIETILDGCNSLVSATTTTTPSSSTSNTITPTSTALLRDQLYEWIFVKRMIRRNKQQNKYN